MTRGNARQDIVHDDDDRRRLLGDLEARSSEAIVRMIGTDRSADQPHIATTSRPNAKKKAVGKLRT
jgi:hypothetical protein